MLVKKFEAPTMKEALELVKVQLGPEAIILAAKENNSSFGFAGKGSVEVTAAVSEVQLKKKQFAEARLKDSQKQRLQQSSATAQKTFIDKSVGRYTRPKAVVTTNQPRRYIEIDDEQTQTNSQVYNRVGYKAQLPQQNFEEPNDISNQRVRDAARSALSAAKSTFVDTETAQSVVRANPTPQSNQELLSLRAEVLQLRGLLETFKSSSQGMISLHPGAEAGLPFEVSALYQRLTESGIGENYSVALCKQSLKELSHEQLKKRPLVDAWAAKHLLSEISLVQDPYAPGLHLFVGASGQGKTASLVKMASHIVLKEKKSIAIFTTDTRRVGTSEQLKIYAQILNVPFAVIRSKEDWVIALQKTRGVYAILVDFPGMALKSLEEIDATQTILPPQEVMRHTHLVLSVNQKDADVFEMARRYKLTHYNDVIFSKLDESINHGLIYNFQKGFHIPLHSFGVGPMIPEDYELATKERVVDLIFKISKLKN